MAARKPSGLGPEFQYDLAPFLKVDPKLVRYEQKAAIATGLENPRGLAVGRDARVYLAGDKAVRVFDADGKPIARLSTAEEPRCIAVGPDNRVYTGMADHVETWDEKGNRLASWKGPGGKAYLTSLAAGESDVFVADAGNRVVLRYDPDGRLVNRIGEKDEAKRAPGFLIPSPYFDLALGRDGMLWIVNPGRRRLECYTYDGEFRFGWGTSTMRLEGFCGCCNPTHVAILPDGRFVTSEKGLPRVKVYGPEGAFESVVAPPSAFNEGAVGLDLATDSAGRVFVLDPHRREVRVFEKKAGGQGSKGDA